MVTQGSGAIDSRRAALVARLQAAQDAGDAKKIGEAQKALLEYDQKNTKDKGTTVEKGPDAPDASERRERSANAQQREIARMNAEKKLAEAKQRLADAPADKKAEAEKNLQVAQAEYDRLSSDFSKKPVEDKPKEAVKQDGQKSTTPETEDPELAQKVREKDKIDTKGGTMHVINGDSNQLKYTQKAPTEKEDYKTNKHKRDDERERMARYYDEETGELITGKDELRAKRKEMKAEKKAAKKAEKAVQKELDAAQKELDDAILANDPAKIAAANRKIREANEKVNQANKDVTEATQEYAQVKQADKAAHGHGLTGDRNAYNKNLKRYNKIADRQQVYFSEAEEKAALEKNPELKGHTETASKDDRIVLQRLYNLGPQMIDKARTDGEKRAAEAVWNNFKDMFPTDEQGNPDFSKADTRTVQTALMNLTGGDGKLDFTEVDMISKELGLSKSDVKHLFKTYGFETSSALGKRIINGLGLAAPVAALSLGEYLLTKSKVTEKAHGDAHAESTSTSTATDDQTAIAKAVADAKAEVPGQKFTWTDADGILHNERIPGQTVVDHQEAIAEAHAHASATATATAVADVSVDVGATAIAKLSPLALWTAPALAFIGGFAKKPVESSATIGGATTEKMSRYVDVFRKNKNKNIGNQLIQYAEGRLTGNKALDEALVVAVLENDIGMQNTNPTTRELRSALAHLDQLKEAIDGMKDIEPPTVPPTEPPTEPPTVPPTPEPYCFDVQEGDVVKPNTYKVEKYDTIDTILMARYPGKKLADVKRQFRVANPGLKDLNSIRVGQEFVLPDLEDGTKPNMDGKVRKVRGGRKIQFRPSKIDPVTGKQTYDVIDCSDPNNKKILSSGLTKEEAQREVDRRSAEASKK